MDSRHSSQATQCGNPVLPLAIPAPWFVELYHHLPYLATGLRSHLIAAGHSQGEPAIYIP